MKFRIFTFLLFPIAVILVFSSTIINPNNPPTGRTGAPGETTCQASGCHTGGAYTGTVEITGLPDTVLANESYTITLTNTSNAIKAGFQLTVLDETNTKAGILTAGTGNSIGNAAGRQYVRQSSPHTLANGSTSWSFNWKAPATVENDSIHFYFATLCANGNGQIAGDNALKNVRSVVLPAFVSATTEQSKKLELKLFPNPTNDFLEVAFSGEGNLDVIGIDGKVLLKTTMINSRKLDISVLPAGLYMVRMESNGKSFVNTFFKKD